MTDQTGLPTYDRSGWAAVAAQRLPSWLSGALLVVSVALIIAAAVDEDGAPFWGAGSAIAAAASAFGYVLQARPRVFEKRWKDIYWDPTADDFRRLGIAYDSEVHGYWDVPKKTHRKGNVPIVRTFESKTGAVWQEVVTDVEITSDGTVIVTVGITKDQADDQSAFRLVIN